MKLLLIREIHRNNKKRWGKNPGWLETVTETTIDTAQFDNQQKNRITNTLKRGVYRAGIYKHVNLGLVAKGLAEQFNLPLIAVSMGWRGHVYIQVYGLTDAERWQLFRAVYESAWPLIQMIIDPKHIKVERAREYFEMRLLGVKKEEAEPYGLAKQKADILRILRARFKEEIKPFLKPKKEVLAVIAQL